jgi:hypothetical protein
MVLNRPAALCCEQITTDINMVLTRQHIVGQSSRACMYSLACRGRVPLHAVLLECCCFFTYKTATVTQPVRVLVGSTATNLLRKSTANVDAMA